MRRPSLTVGLAILSALGLVAAVAVMPSLATNHITVEPLTGRAAFTDNVDLKFKVKFDGRATEVINFSDPSLTQVVKFTVQPGAGLSDRLRR